MYASGKKQSEEYSKSFLERLNQGIAAWMKDDSVSRALKSAVGFGPKRKRGEDGKDHNSIYRGGGRSRSILMPTWFDFTNDADDFEYIECEDDQHTREVLDLGILRGRKHYIVIPKRKLEAVDQAPMIQSN